MSPVSPAGGAANYLDTLDRARAGVDAGVQSAAIAARAVATDGVRGRLSGSHLTDALAVRGQAALAARRFRTADQMLGTLLELRA